MPRVKLVTSLLTICVKCIRTQISNSDFSAKLSASKLADASVSKMEMNPFHQLGETGAKWLGGKMRKLIYRVIELHQQV